MKRFVYLRIFLTESERLPILEAAGEYSDRVERQDYLFDVFNRRWSFTHRGTDQVYVPINRDENDRPDIVFGRIGRQVRSTENAGPDEEFELTDHVGWRAANLILRTNSDPNGQILAFEDRGDVGKPLAIANSLTNHINEAMSESGWLIDVNQMVEKQSFWDAVNKYKGQITRAEFTYVTPNVLGIRSVLNERLREYRAKENAQQVGVTLHEPKGNLQLHTDEVRDAVDYISDGGGTAKLKSGRETIYDSEDSEKARDLGTDDDMSFENPDTRDRVSRQIFE